MKSMIRIGFGLTALLWTLLTWGGYALIMLASGMLASGTTFFGLTGDLAAGLQAMIAVLEQIGIVVLIGVWALGLLGIGLMGWFAPQMITQGMNMLRGTARQGTETERRDPQTPNPWS